MFRFHQIKEQAKSDDYYSSWYVFNSYDVFTHTATATGLQLTQILNGITSMLNSYRRLPTILVIIMGERLMYDKHLQRDELQDVLRSFCKKIIRLIECWLDKVPSKARPIRKPQIYITKPLPKPSALITSTERIREYASIRRQYNTKLVHTVKEFGIGFINVGINQEDGAFFKETSHRHIFQLSKDGLNAYWMGVSAALANLAELFTDHSNNNKQSDIKNSKDKKSTITTAHRIKKSN